MGTSQIQRRTFDALGWASATKSITFSNTTGAPVMFTVTGDVIVKLVVVTTTNLASAGGCSVELGISASAGAMVASTSASTLDAREIWHDTASDSEIEALSTMREYIISDGNDIVLTLDGQADSGALTLYCFWIPLSDGASVVAA